MAGGHVNRTVLQSFYQSPGQIYEDTKTEGAIETVAAQVDANWDDYAAHNHDTRYYLQQQVDTKITQAMLGNPPLGGVTLPMLAPDIQNKLNQVYSVEREVANLKAISTIANRTDGASGIIYDLNDGLNGGSIGKIDLTKTNIVGTVAIGAVTVTVKSVTGLIVGQEVTVFDDTNREYAIISAINTGTKQLTFAAPLTKAYQDQAEVARSTVTQDTINRLIKFGGWSKISTFTAASTVVASAYDTSGNGGRKVTVLSNGWIVAAAVNGTTQIVFEVSKDNGATFTQLCFITISASPQGLAIASSGTNVSVLTTTAAGTSASFYKFDAATVTNVAQTAISTPLSGQSSFGSGCSIAIDSTGSIKITACSKNATYPNSFNPIAQKSTDGLTWTKMDGVAGFDQIINTNTAGLDYTNPCVVVTSNNNSVVVCQFHSGTTNYNIYAQVFSGSSWSQYNIYLGAANNQSNPSAYIKTKGANIGRIITRWHGFDATDTTKQNERWSYSDDGGATWSAMAKITTGNTIDRQKGVLCEDASGNIFDVYMDGAGISYQKLPNGTTTWGGLTTLDAAGTNPAVVDQLDFTVPLTVYMSASTVKFKGTWIAGVITPVLVEDVRYNISPANNISNAVTWVDRETDAGLSLAAALSIHSATEAYSAMTKTTATVDGTTSEDQFEGAGTSNNKATVRLTMTRTSTSVNKGIKSVMGAVGA